MKKVICVFVFIVMLIASVFTVSVSAAPSDVIEKADIHAYLNADGTVNVTETWTVSYINASDYFYRNIDIYADENSMTLLQKYEEVKDVSVKIDGKTAPPSSAGINTYSFMKSADGKSYDITINCPSAQTTREYEISYTLTGALKKKSGDAVFSFIFIGKTFIYTSNNVTVTVHFPDGTENIAIPEGIEGNAEGNTVTFSSKRVYDTFAVEVSADKSVFEDGALVSYSSAAENLIKVKTAFVAALPWIAVAVAITAVVLFVLFPDRLIRIPAEKRALRLIKNGGNNASASLPDGVTACGAYKMLHPISRVMPKSTSKKVPALFAMAILECMEKGYIVPEGDILVVGTPANGAPAYIMSVLNFLKTLSEQKDDRYVIDKNFAENVTTECMSRYDVIANYLATFYSLIPDTNAKFFRNNINKEKYENAYIVKIKAMEIKHKPTFAQCMGDVLSGKKTSDAEVFAMLLSSSSADKFFAKGGRSGEAALCEALNAMYKVFVKSK